MRKLVVTAKVLASLLNAANPFGLVDDQGNSRIFHDMVNCYFTVLTKLYDLSPRCYLETPLILRVLYADLSFNDCKLLAEELKKLGCPDVYLNAWDTRSTQKYCEGLLRGLCSFNATNFDMSYFNEAWNLLQLYIEGEEAKKAQNKAML